MDEHYFDDVQYLIIFYYSYNGNGFHCYSCRTKQEVFQILTDRAYDAAEFIRESNPDLFDDLQSNPDTADIFILLDSADCISNPEIINSFFDVIYQDEGRI